MVAKKKVGKEGDLTRMVTLSKDGVEHEFVAESVPVWLESGWKVVDDSAKESDEDESKPTPTKRTAAK